MPTGCSSRTLALAFAVAAGLPVSEAAAEPTSRERRIRIAAIAGAMALYVVSETVAKDAISPDRCRWCSVGSFDEGVRELVVWEDTKRAARLSDLIGYGLAPVTASALLAVTSERWGEYGDDMTAMFEVIWGTQLVTQLVKISAGRQRPYAHYGNAGAPSQEDNLSFFSGHSSLTFSIAVGAGVIAQRRGYRLAPVIWTTGLAIAATTAYLRMAADRHYFTDVLVGGAAGALGGALIPRLTGSLPPRTAPMPSRSGGAASEDRARLMMVPQPGGLALVGWF